MKEVQGIAGLKGRDLTRIDVHRAAIGRDAASAAVCATPSLDVSHPLVHPFASVSPSVMRDTLANCFAPSLRSKPNQAYVLSEAPKFIVKDQIERKDEDVVSPRLANDQVERKDEDFVCLERSGRSQWKYICSQRSNIDPSRSPFEVSGIGLNRNPLANFFEFLKSHVIPEGYPESVAPSYTPYMQWRALQYFFGGAMGVFTTRSLLHAVGASQIGSASSAIAVNWAIKDGAGRIGKMLFARHGKRFDCDLKQLRFAGDLLMQLGAGIELATMAAPHLFLPLACAANVAKNVAAVSATSTRTPIYKAFARSENIGDVTAKGECTSNIADLLGTGLGIWMSKKSFNPVVIFGMLSCGYIVSSYKEVRVLQLPTLNCARFGVAVQIFLKTGRVPSFAECNRKEPILLGPWRKEKSVELGARVSNAFATPSELMKFKGIFKKESYLLTYHQGKKRAFVVLKESIKSDDILRATFHAHFFMSLLHDLKSCERATSHVHPVDADCVTYSRGDSDLCLVDNMDIALHESCKKTPLLYDAFKKEAKSQGWIMAESLLNPGEARVSL